jgi:hypothetical protein
MLWCRPRCSICRCRISAAASTAAAAAGSRRGADSGPHHSVCLRPAGGRLLRAVGRLLPHRLPDGSAAAAVRPHRSRRERGPDLRRLCAANLRPQGRQQPRGGFALHFHHCHIFSLMGEAQTLHMGLDVHLQTHVSMVPEVADINSASPSGVHSSGSDIDGQRRGSRHPRPWRAAAWQPCSTLGTPCQLDAHPCRDCGPCSWLR